MPVPVSYRSLFLYYWSGTGNSYRAAQWVSQYMAPATAPVQFIPMDRQHRPSLHPSGALAGFFLPAHGFTAPWAVIRFILSLPSGCNTAAVVIVTRGASKIGPVFFPGMEGTALWLISLILFCKGYHLRGNMGLDMPSNWMSLHSSLNSRSVERVLQRAQKKLQRFSSDINKGKLSYNGWISLSLGIFLIPASLLYLAMGRFFLAKLFFASYRCNGCGLCTQCCPTGSLVMQPTSPPRPYWRCTCESCMRCMGYCPEKAIECSHSFGALLYYLFTVSSITWWVWQTASQVPAVSAINNPLLPYLLTYLGSLLALFLSYHIFQYLLRIPIINRFFSLTTFTHIYRRYHEPGTPLKELTTPDDSSPKP